MRRTYIKPESIVYIVEAAPILDASFGDGNAEKDQPVLSKHHNKNGYSFEDDFEDEEEEFGDIEF